MLEANPKEMKRVSCPDILVVLRLDVIFRLKRKQKKKVLQLPISLFSIRDNETIETKNSRLKDFSFSVSFLLSFEMVEIHLIGSGGISDCRAIRM